jgi:hypothetical protein
VSGETYLVVSDSGEPIGLFDRQRIEDEGCRFAFALAAACGHPAELDRVQAETLARVGTESFGYIAANALRVVVEHILSPVLDVAEAHGTDLRASIRAVAESRDPGGDPG